MNSCWVIIGTLQTAKTEDGDKIISFCNTCVTVVVKSFVHDCIAKEFIYHISYL